MEETWELEEWEKFEISDTIAKFEINKLKEIKTREEEDLKLTDELFNKPNINVDNKKKKKKKNINKKQNINKKSLENIKKISIKKIDNDLDDYHSYCCDMEERILK